MLQNQFDCIDLSDNNVVRLDGFPKLERLSMFIANSNRIASIAPALESALCPLLSCHAWNVTGNRNVSRVPGHQGYFVMVSVMVAC